MKSTHPSITDRLLSTFPSGTYCLPALLALAEITETNEVPSAAVECVARPRLLINPRWVERHAETPEKLVMLVMHELHHVVLGHTRLYPRLTRLDNLVFDAVINSMLCHLFPARAYRALMIDCYDDAKFPECFLRPPERWRPGGPVDTPRALLVPGRIALAPLYERLYSEGGGAYEELRHALGSSPEARAIELDRLLGDHRPEEGGASSAGNLEARSPVLLEEIRRIVERWPRPPKPIAGRTLHGVMERARFRLPPPGPRSQLVGLLRRIARRGRGAAGRLPEWADWEGEGPILRIDRRTTVLRALGMCPLLQRTPSRRRRLASRQEPVHVYLDVSGSVNSILGALARAVIDCREQVHPDVHLFSEQVVDASIDELKAGVAPTTQGTSIECVAEHLERHGIRRAVLVTDGYVGMPGVRARRTLSQCTLGVALTPGNSTRNDLEGLAAHWTTLNGGTP